LAKDKDDKAKKDELAKGKDGKKDGKDGKKDNLAKGKDGKGAKDGAFGGDSLKGPKAPADLAREEWGRLPLRDRMEMDALPNERFLPRYEKLLRKYYRNAGEKDGR